MFTWTDGQMDGRTDDGRKVITIAHPEQSSGELKIAKTETIRNPRGLPWHHLVNLFCCLSPDPKEELTRNLVGKSRANCRSNKRLNSSDRASFCPLSPEQKGHLTRNLLGQLTDQKYLKSFRSEIQDGLHGGHLENLFYCPSPELKGQLTRN